MASQSAVNDLHDNTIVGEVPKPQEPNDNSEDYDYENSDYDSDSVSEISANKKEKSRKPGDNAFRQQRLKAYNPVLTVKTVIPILIGIAIIFAPLGAAMWYASHKVQDMSIDYSQCEKMASSDYWQEIPEEYINFNFKTKDRDVSKPLWKLATNDSEPFEDERNVCRLQFEIPNDLAPPIYFFYRLDKFYANHRRYAKSFSEDQIEGKAASVDTIKNTVGQNCEPLSVNHEGKKYYPCGLIANSLFNDTFTTTLRQTRESRGPVTKIDSKIPNTTIPILFLLQIGTRNTLMATIKTTSPTSLRGTNSKTGCIRLGYLHSTS